MYSERRGKLCIHRSASAARSRPAAAAGWNPPAIAESLGHNSTKNVMVYVEAIPDIAARIDQSHGERDGAAAAFAGTLIKDESEAVCGGDPAS